MFRTRALLIKARRAELVKHHLWMLWTDYFKPPHFEKYPELHDLFYRATKAAGATGGNGSVDPAEGQKLLDLTAEIDTIFCEPKTTEQARRHACRPSRRLPTSRASPPAIPPSTEIPAATVVPSAARGASRRPDEVAESAPI